MAPGASRPRAGFSRRQFMSCASTAAVAFTVLKPALALGTEANNRLSLGLIGCGNRGTWIADLFLKHGGYHFAAVADYFPERAEEAGEKLGVPSGLRFSGLQGYQRLLEQPLDAVVIESPPWFHPTQAADAVAAGKHVFLAKPVAVDVPGCLAVEESARRATARRLCFLVDFQTRANAGFQGAVRSVREGMIGRLASAEASYVAGSPWESVEALRRAQPDDPEVRLRAWGADRRLSGDIITEQNIHALDVATWFLDAAPLRACGTGGRILPPGGDIWNFFSVIFHFPNDLVLSFHSKQFGYGLDDIQCRVYGLEGTADAHYFGKVMVRARDDFFDGGAMKNLYSEGAINNIATFHRSIVNGDFSNPTVAPSVRSNLTTMLGRTAAYRHGEVTWEQMMQANERWEADLKGLRD